MSNPIFCIFAFSLLSINLFGQELKDNKTESTESARDTTVLDNRMLEQVPGLDPDRAMMLSAVLPGLGQVYNKQYWKIPLIYSGLATFAHFIGYNNDLYHSLRNAVISDQRGLPHPFSNIVRSKDVLIRNRDQFRRNRDLLIIIGTVFYLLNVVDAHVSAHLSAFDISDDLSLQVEPSFKQTFFSQAAGVSLVLKF